MTDEAKPEPAKLYLVVRSDLKMGRGKEIAQAVHAFRFMSPQAVQAMEIGTPVIGVRADCEFELLAIMGEVAAVGGWVSPVRDAGHTHNAPGTLTCAAIGPISTADKAECPYLLAARLY